MQKESGLDAAQNIKESVITHNRYNLRGTTVRNTIQNDDEGKIYTGNAHNLTQRL